MQLCLKRLSGWRVAGHIPSIGEVEQEAARVFYLAATRATQRLVIGWVAPKPLGGACDEITKPHTLPNNL